MGTIQNSVNQGLGSIGAVATMGKHIANQNKELAVKKIEAERDVMNAKEALLENDAKYFFALSTDVFQNSLPLLACSLPSFITLSAKSSCFLKSSNEYGIPFLWVAFNNLFD